MLKRQENQGRVDVRTASKLSHNLVLAVSIAAFAFACSATVKLFTATTTNATLALCKIRRLHRKKWICKENKRSSESPKRKGCSKKDNCMR
jgi:hypothetical protein